MKSAEEMGFIGFDKYFLVCYHNAYGYNIQNLYVLKITDNNVIYTSGTIFDGKPTNRLFIRLNSPDLFTSFEAAKQEIIVRSQYKIASYEQRIARLKKIDDIVVSKNVDILTSSDIPKDIKV